MINDIIFKDTYTTKDKFIIGGIIEYDMVDAGFSLVQEFKQLPSPKINTMKKFNKSKRKIIIGLEMKKDKDFSKEHTKSFGLARERFYRGNGLLPDNILSIRKDAIFVLDRVCSNLKVGEYIEFAPKHVYTSFHKIHPYEFYYNSKTDTLDCKGLKDAKLELHDDGMNIFLKKIFRMVEDDSPLLIQSLYNFVRRYKDKALPPEYYRTFDSNSGFIVQVNDDLFSSQSPREINRITMIVNYEDIIMELMKIHYYAGID